MPRARFPPPPLFIGKKRQKQSQKKRSETESVTNYTGVNYVQAPHLYEIRLRTYHRRGDLVFSLN